MDPRPPNAPAQRAPADTDPTPGTLVEPYHDRPPRADPPLGPPQSPDEIGRLGPYRVLAELGRGGMGAVYRAEDPRLERQVALKVLLPDLAANPRSRARFVREARAQAKVEHDHIIPIHAVEEAESVTFLVMPLLKGQTLSAALKLNPRPPLGELVRIGREIAEGLAAAHAVGLIHRDIKPGNVWLEGNRRRVKILDFGLARTDTAAPPAPDDAQPGPSPTRADDARTATGTIMGTPAYMSPEQARSRPLDHRSDLFSLGVVLYQMATGRMPFTGPSAFDVAAAVVTHVPPAIHELVPDAPPALSELIRRLMSKDPAERPPSAEAVAEELAEIERGLAASPAAPPLDVPGEPNPWAEIVTPDLTPAAEDATTSVETDEPPRRRAPKRLWPVVAVGLAAVGGLGWLAVTGPSRPGARPDAARDEPESGTTEPKGQFAKTADRRAAEVLLREKVRLQVRLPSGGTLEVGSEDQLPKDDRFEITEIFFPPVGRRPADFAAAVLLPAIGELKSLTAVRDENHTVRWTEDEIVALTKAPCRAVLTDLFTEFPLTPKTAKSIAGLPALKNLTCGAESADDEALVALVRAPRLESVNLRALGKQQPVTAVGWRALTALPLKALILDGPDKVDVLACELFGRMPQLAQLRLVGSKLGVPELRALGRSNSLTEVELSRCQIPDAALVHLAALPELKFLDLARNPITDAGLTHLSRAARLRVLSLRHTNVTDDGAARLARTLSDCLIHWGGDKGKTIEPARKPTGGLEFDGKQTRVNVPAFRFDGRVPFTVEAWVTPAAVRYAHIFVVSEYGGIGTSGDNAFGAGFLDGATWQTGYSGDKLRVGETAHVAAVVLADRIDFYVNGRRSGTKKGLNLGGLRPTDSPARMGTGVDKDGSEPFQGTIHGVRVSRGVRYDKEFVPAVTWDADADTVALYAFDEGAGPTVKDRSPNRFHADVKDGRWVPPKK